MIGQSEVQRIGTIVKPHGVSGEMAIAVPASLEWTDDLDCLVCSMDGILVPFWIESLREKSRTTLLVKFENIDTVEQTSRFIGVTVYMPVRFIAETETGLPSWSMFIGWSVTDATAGLLGSIAAVDESTPNVLFLVREGERERIIPANEEWITGVDKENRTIVYNLPEGLAEL